jgi:hypothetical protein
MIPSITKFSISHSRHSLSRHPAAVVPASCRQSTRPLLLLQYKYCSSSGFILSLFIISCLCSVPLFELLYRLPLCSPRYFGALASSYCTMFVSGLAAFALCISSTFATPLLGSLSGSKIDVHPKDGSLPRLMGRDVNDAGGTDLPTVSALLSGDLNRLLTRPTVSP